MISTEHKKYLKKRKKEFFIILFLQIFLFLFFLFLWQFLADKHIINTFISSSPKDMLKTFISLWKINDLWGHIGITIYETLLSLCLGTIIGVIIASIFWWFPILAKIMEPYLTIINSLPKVALGPILIIWIGANQKSIIVMALLISVILTIINVHEGFKSVDKNKLDLLISLKATKFQQYIYLMFPHNLRVLASVLKINISMSLIGVIMGEFLVSKKGIGYLIMYGSQVFNLDLVMTGIFILCIVATLLYVVMDYLTKRFVHYE